MRDQAFQSASKEFSKRLSDFGFWRVFTNELEMTDAQTLLADYIGNRSEAAFRDLVGRYTNFVYSIALRLVDSDRQLAEDVSQNVFIDLARMAPTLSPNVTLGGWLHRHTCFLASKAMRSERRRRAREKQAIAMNACEDHSEANLSRVAPIIDDAINQLAEPDRLAIVLRFFDQRDLRSVGKVLGSTEDTAQKRVSRALEKLHLLLEKRGIKFSAVALGTALSAEAITAAPAGLAGTFAATALAASFAGGGATSTFAALLTMTKLKVVIISIIGAVGVATPLWIQHRMLVDVRQQNDGLRQQVAQLAPLTVENEQLSNQIARASSSLASNQMSELLKLRGEVGNLRRELSNAAKKEKTSAQVSKETTQPDAMQDEKEIGIAKMNYTKYWMLAFILYADEHQGQFPVTFDSAESFFPPEAKGQPNIRSDQFEIMYQGKVDEVTSPATIIVIREKEAWQLNGGWVKTYGFADGHCEVHRAVDGDFGPWESQHMMVSQSTGQK